MKKHKAFTLIEIGLSVVIIGFLATLMYKKMQNPTDDVYDKLSKAKVYKALNLVQQASESIADIESEKCPMKTFMMNVAGEYEYTFVNSSGVNANTSEVLSTFQDYIKFQQAPLNFCDYTSYCDDDDIKGGKIIGDIYIGFEIYGNDIANCPDYYLPDDDSEITGKGKCWGNLYIKLAGNRNSGDVLGKDVFLFGLNDKGVAY